MSGKSGIAPIASAKPALLHELGVDLVERAAAVGQLHAGLELGSAGRPWAAPIRAVGVQALDEEGLAAGAARGRQVEWPSRR
jgi:hypothetical protein